MRLLVLPPGVPPPAGPAPPIPRCNPPPATVCARARAGSPLARACTVRVPKVSGSGFPAALERLRAAGLLVAVPRFPPFRQALSEQGWNRLETYVVGGQRPAVGTRVARGSVVRLTIEPPRFRGPIGSLALPNVFPPTFTAPNLVGLTDRAAFAVAAQPSSAFWLKLDGAPPLHASASRCGEDAFVVASQEPAAGTTMPSYGVVAGRTGVRPALSTITLTLTTRCRG